MAKRATNLRLDEDKLAQIDALAGPRGRTAWIERAIDNQLARAEQLHTEAPPGGIGEIPEIPRELKITRRRRRTSTPETRNVQPIWKDGKK